MQVNDNNKPTILFIGFVWPEITSTAASQNIISYLQVFANAGYTVHFASAAQPSPLSTDLAQFGVSSHSILLNSDCFDDFVATLAPDIVVFDRFLSEEQFAWRVMKTLPQALRILDCEDLHFLRHARHQLYKLTGYRPNKAEYLEPDAVLKPQHKALLHNPMTSRELACIYRCDLVLVLSEFEQQLLLSHFNLNKEQLLHAPYLLQNAIIDEAKNDVKSETKNALKSEVKYEQITSLKNPSGARTDFISIGNFRHAPNIDAVNVLIQHLWPAIHKALPHTRCHIYGAYLPPKIKHLHDPKKGLHVHGHIDDHVAVMRKAKVLLAPIQFGAGVKGKIVDALRYGLPSVSTPIGLEGIKFEQWPGANVQEREDFIQAAIQSYLATPAQFAQMQQSMQTILKNNFDFDTHSRQLLSAVEDALLHIASRRVNNFMQQLVSHHSLQTHQYMSQWIAAKNANVD